MANEYVVNIHKINPLIKQFPDIYVQCREKQNNQKVSVLIQFLAGVVVKCLNTGIAGRTN